ncbi:IMPACT family protein [Rhodococcus pyridinivorans]|uniref:YigZ family protein n=2 Tax=Rhodococcus TaxID=1827 RepID=A0A7M2XQZ0_9NOCA|nr:MULTISPECIES: YigZ family protein [Rhodococcus]OBA35888.1 IMPACT family protein [Rhodococcus sp. 852002-51564_SCH6189132-a]QOV99752.1 YigZ family protein [Rhodococcus pyridinivorans]UPW03574.1 IMPACT family protein [Rhodococcus pyridinivorans]USI91200.1 IMPACT family protein [Rhodococcus pyridinivorans]UTM38164.1 IMPACT family protein [Rhodococcus pyridinivorans]
MPHTLAPGPDVVVETEVKHSRFLAAVRRVDTADAALAFVDEQRRLYPDARHHCWAFVVGDDPSARAERSSDDGEPGGTAGIPMLQVLHHRDLVNVAVVVTRWFGGIKLGAGGLVRAYSGAVATALDEAPLVERRQQEKFTLAIDHGEAGRVEAELRGRGVAVLDVAYADRVVLTVAGRERSELEGWVASLTSGAGELEPAGVDWIDS